MPKGLKPATWQSAGTPLEAPDRNSQSPEGAVQRTYSSARGIHVAQPRRGGEWRPRNMMGGKCPLWVKKLDPQAVARKLDEIDEMHAVIAKWKGDKQARKTDVECRKTTWNPRPKITVIPRLRTYSLAKGIHVARRWRPWKIDGRHRWGWWITARRQGESESNYLTGFNNKLTHPQSNAESPDQAQWPKIQINPIDSWSSQPSNSCTTWLRQINQNKVTTPERHKPEPCHVAMPEAGQSLDQSWKRRFPRLTKGNKARYCGQLVNQWQTTAWKAKEGEARYCGQLFNMSTFDRLRSEKLPAVSLDELLD